METLQIGFSILIQKKKNFYWVLISLDNYVPKNIKKNIAIIANKKKCLSIIYFIFLKV